MFIEDMWSISSYMQSEQPYAIGILLLIYFNDGWEMNLLIFKVIPLHVYSVNIL